MTASDNSIVKSISTATTASELDDPKRKQRIDDIQEEDRWKAEQTRQVPIAITDLRMSRYTHDYLEIAVEVGKTTSWTMRKTAKDFKRLVKAMDAAFPIEAGLVANHKRIIPSLDLSRSIFTRKQTIYEKITLFLQELIKMPGYILQSKLVTEFFVNNSDAQASISAGSSNESESGTGSYRSETIRYKIKVKSGEEMALVFIPSENISVAYLTVQVAKKFPKHHNATKFVYQDHDGDEILVADDEDLDIALKIHPRLLTLSTIEH